MDASSLYNSVIGGRLDWKAFSGAVRKVFPALLAAPIPYPPRPPRGKSPPR